MKDYKGDLSGMILDAAVFNEASKKTAIQFAVNKNKIKRSCLIAEAIEHEDVEAALWLAQQTKEDILSGDLPERFYEALQRLPRWFWEACNESNALIQALNDVKRNSLNVEELLEVLYQELQ